jgi:hypothetical protein
MVTGRVFCVFCAVLGRVLRVDAVLRGVAA